MSKSCGCSSDSVAVNGIYTSPVDLNTLIKPGRFKVKLGNNRPNNTTKSADALVSNAKHEHCIIQSVLILSGLNVGKTFTRSSFTDGTTWTEYITSSDPDDSGKLDKNFDNLSTRNPLEPGDMFVVWSGEDSFRVSADSLKEFISGQHDKGYVNRVSNLQRIPGQKGDYIVVLETSSLWIWDEEWKNTSQTTSAEELLGFEGNDIINYLNNIVEILNDTNFMSHFYSGYTILGNIQKIPGINTTDKLLLTFGGITLKQDEDFKISKKNEITIIGIEVGRDIPIHVFKMENLKLPYFLP